MSEEKICPLCLKPVIVSSYFGHFPGGGICTTCYNYLRDTFQVILVQNIVQGIEYLADLKSKEE